MLITFYQPLIHRVINIFNYSMKLLITLLVSTCNYDNFGNVDMLITLKFFTYQQFTCLCGKLYLHVDKSCISLDKLVHNFYQHSYQQGYTVVINNKNVENFIA
jgi:hypothetical protein